MKRLTTQAGRDPTQVDAAALVRGPPVSRERERSQGERGVVNDGFDQRVRIASFVAGRHCPCDDLGKRLQPDQIRAACLESDAAHHAWSANARFKPSWPGTRQTVSSSTRYARLTRDARYAHRGRKPPRLATSCRPRSHAAAGRNMYPETGRSCAPYRRAALNNRLFSISPLPFFRRGTMAKIPRALRPAQMKFAICAVCKKSQTARHGAISCAPRPWHLGST